MFSRIILTFVLFLLTFFISASTIKACTYEASITGNHLDINITSDRDYIQFVQFMHINNSPSAPYKVTKLYGPGEYPWAQYLDGQQSYRGYSMVIQNRRQNADAAYWVSWLDANHYLNILPGIYGLDFSGTMTYSDISVEYGTMDENGNFGIGDAWHFCTRIGDVTLPSPTPTPTPSPSPPAKVLLIPGLGASWNAKAMLTCGEADSNGWTLMPLAEQYYQPIIDALTNAGKTVIPFYYDWRDNIQNNSQILSQNLPDEKVDIVSHSMGGLIARGAVQNISADKINSLYLVGTPNHGSIIAYPAWEWGQVWSDNFIYKVALTLYLKGCGFKNNTTDAETIHRFFPSIQDILPTTNDYLKDKSGNTILSESNNLWLKNLNSLNLPEETRFGTLSGDGFDTLETIKIKNDTNTKSNGKISSAEGDGTVLLDSSRLENVPFDIINEKHSDLIASEEGILKVFNFLGIDQTPNLISSYQEPNSALILVSYPSNFWVTDQEGKVHKDKGGMVNILDPKPGSYKLNIISSSVDNLFAVAQFLPNGEVKYKEYKTKGIGPIIKTLKFNPDNPKDDILN